MLQYFAIIFQIMKKLRSMMVTPAHPGGEARQPIKTGVNFFAL